MKEPSEGINNLLKKGIFNHWKKDVNCSLVKKSRKMSCICNYTILYFCCFENMPIKLR
ncbi:hypothetical protein HMPREF2532_01578 [Bacteroides ovatus]|nr:hypothetical protein HMPREF2532_01578 [Bacteroides ovatus]